MGYQREEMKDEMAVAHAGRRVKYRRGLGKLESFENFESIGMKNGVYPRNPDALKNPKVHKIEPAVMP